MNKKIKILHLVPFSKRLKRKVNKQYKIPFSELNSKGFDYCCVDGGEVNFFYTKAFLRKSKLIELHQFLMRK